MTNTELLKLKELIETRYHRLEVKLLIAAVMLLIPMMFLVVTSVEITNTFKLVLVITAIFGFRFLSISLKFLAADRIREKQYKAMKDFKPTTSLENLRNYPEFKMLYE